MESVTAALKLFVSTDYKEIVSFDGSQVHQSMVRGQPQRQIACLVRINPAYHLLQEALNGILMSHFVTHHREILYSRVRLYGLLLLLGDFPVCL